MRMPVCSGTLADCLVCVGASDEQVTATPNFGPAALDYFVCDSTTLILHDASEEDFSYYR